MLPHFCTSYLPLTHSSRTSHAIAPLLLAFSLTLFVALPRGRLGPPWARLGAIFAPCWGHIQPSAGCLQVFWGSSWGLPGRADISFRTARPKHTSTTHIQTMCPKETTYPYITKVSLRAMQQQAWISFGGRPTSCRCSLLTTLGGRAGYGENRKLLRSYNPPTKWGKKPSPSGSLRRQSNGATLG